MLVIFKKPVHIFALRSLIDHVYLLFSIGAGGHSFR